MVKSLDISATSPDKYAENAAPSGDRVEVDRIPEIHQWISTVLHCGELNSQCLILDVIACKMKRILEYKYMMVFNIIYLSGDVFLSVHSVYSPTD